MAEKLMTRERRVWRILSNICTHCEMQSFIYLDGGWDRAERETARKPQGEEAFEELMAMLITF